MRIGKGYHEHSSLHGCFKRAYSNKQAKETLMFFNPLFFCSMVMSMQMSAAFWMLKVAYDPRALWLVSQRYPDCVPLTKGKSHLHVVPK